MRAESHKRGSIFILLVFTLVLLMTFAAVPVLAPAIISWPEGTMGINPGENFTLRHRMRWDEAAPGFYTVTITWDYFGDNSWHFTLDSASAYFDNNNDNLPDSGVDPIDATVSISDNGSRYTLQVRNVGLGDSRDGEFNVDLTLRASGPDGSPHAAGDHPILYLSPIRCREESSRTKYPAVTVRVINQGAAVSISPDENENLPGENVEFTVTVTNTGNLGIDSYNLTFSDTQGWLDNITLSENWFELPEDNTGDATLTLTIPNNAVPGTWDNITVTATSQENENVSDNYTCVAHVTLVQGVDISISPPENSAKPGENVTFTVTVINTGNVSDTYTLEVSDNAVWSLSLDNTSLTVPENENRTTTLRVTIHENAIAYRKDNITVTATSSENENVENSASCIASAMPAPGVEVSIVPENKSGLIGDNVIFEVTVKNTGNIIDNYELENIDDVSPGWSLTLSDNLVDNRRLEKVAPGDNRILTLTVTIPENEDLVCTWDNITVTATSQENTEVSDNDNCMVHVTFSARVEVSISPLEKSAPPGENLYYTITVTNTGNIVDNYELENTDNAGWLLALSENLLTNVENGTSQEVTLTVTIPEDAEEGTRDNITVTATSQANENVSDNASCIGHALAFGVEVSVSPAYQSGHPYPLQTLTYEVTVKNVGPENDNYSLGVTDNSGWQRTLDNLLVENVPPGENSKTYLRVTIPHLTQPCTEDNIIVTATSQTYPTTVSDNASCIAHSAIVDVEVSISPSENESLPGENVTFTVTVTNTGDAEDNFNLTVSDNTGWGPTLSDNLPTIPAGEQENVTLSVTIPDNENLVCTRDNIIVTATSQADDAVSDNASCIAHAGERRVEVSISPENQSGLHGWTLTYQVMVKNVGLKNDNYSLGVTDDRWWSPTLDDNLFENVAPGDNRTTTISVTIPLDASPGTEDEITVTATSQANPAVSDYASCIAHTDLVDFEVSISPSRQSGEFGYHDLAYTVTVTNNGTIQDTYHLTTSDNLSWNMDLRENKTNRYGDIFKSGDLLTVPAGKNRSIILYVEVYFYSAVLDRETVAGDEDNITVTATSQTDNTVSDNGSCIARVAYVDFEVTISPSYQIGSPGEDLVYTVTVTNTGDGASHKKHGLYIRDSTDWEPTIDVIDLIIASGESEETRLRVTIPDNATHNTRDNLTVEVRATQVHETPYLLLKGSSAIAQAGTLRLFISPGEDSARPGENLTFTVVVTNVGIENDNYDLTASGDAGWSLTFSENLLENVTPGESRMTTLSVAIPENATLGTDDNTIVTVIPGAGPAASESENCIAIAAPPRGVRVSVSPESQGESAGENLEYVVIVRNFGTEDDSYDLTVSDTQGWSNNIFIFRGFVYFDTSSLPDDAYVTAATLSLCGKADGSQTDFDIVVQNGQETYPHDPLEPGDYDHTHYSENGGSFNTSGFATGLYNNIALNSTGRSWIRKDGITKFCLRSSRDINGTQPEDDIVEGAEVVYVYASEKGTGYKPKLTVTYLRTLGGGGSYTDVFYSTSSDGHVSRYDTDYQTIRDNTSGTVDNNDLDFGIGQRDISGSITFSENLLVVPGLERRSAILEVAIPREAVIGTVDNITVTVTSRENAAVSDNARYVARVEPVIFKGDELSSEEFIVRGDATTYNADAGMEGDYPPEVLYSLGDYPPLMAARRVENGAVVAAGLVSTTRGTRWEPGKPTGKLDVLLDLAFQWMVPGAENVLWYGECEVGVELENENYYVEDGVYNDAGEGKAAFLIEVLTDRGYTMEDTRDGEITRITSSLLEDYNILVIPELQLGGWGANGGDTSLLPDNDVQAIKSFVEGGGGLLIMEGTDSFNFNFCKVQNKILTGLGIEDVYFQSDGVYKNGGWAFDAEVTDVDFGEDYRDATGLTQVWVYSTCSLVVKPEKKELDVSLSISSYLEGLPGETLTYTLTITNTGKFDDAYILDAVDNAGFASSVSPSMMILAAGASDNVTLSVTIPEGTPRGTESRIMVVVTSVGDPTLGDVVYGEAWTGALGVSVWVDEPTSKSGLPGENLKFYVYVKNTGDFEDSYDLSVSDNVGWGPTLNKYSLTIENSIKKFVTLSVIIPENAASGAVDDITITVTSQTDSTVRAENSCTAHAAFTRGVKVSITPSEDSALAGENLTFIVKVTNLGDISDNFGLTVSDNAGWGPTISPSTLALAAGASGNVTLTVGIPDNAVSSTRDNIRVLARSLIDNEVSAENSCIAYVAAAKGVTVSILPPSKSGAPGEELTFTVTVTNTGDDADSYELTVSDNAGWGAALAENLLTIPAGENRTATVSVTVPSDTTKDESTMITVITISRSDSTQSDTTTCETKAREKPQELPIVPIGVGGVAIGGGIAAMLLLKKGVISLPFLRSRLRRVFSRMDLSQSRPMKRSLLTPRPFRSS